MSILNDDRVRSDSADRRSWLWHSVYRSSFHDSCVIFPGNHRFRPGLRHLKRPYGVQEGLDAQLPIAGAVIIATTPSPRMEKAFWRYRGCLSTSSVDAAYYEKLDEECMLSIHEHLLRWFGLRGARGLHARLNRR